MKFNHHKTLSLLIFGFLIITGCNPNNQVTETIPNAQETTTESSPNPTNIEPETAPEHPPVSQGGQVVEVGNYHLELVTLPENGGAHLDFYLQRGDNHENIADADVRADLQLPDGTEKQLNFTYDVPGEHYTTDLSGIPRGQYQMRVTATVEGETVSGRFSFQL